MARLRILLFSFNSPLVALLLLPILCGVAIAEPHPIAKAQFITIGGIQQWVTIRGNDRTKPVLIFLHGGPGDAQSALVTTYAPYEKNFVLVQWDQRNAGRTLGHYSSEFQPTSLNQVITDGIELTTYVRKHLHTNRVILMGHSWGSFLGVQMVKRRPDLFNAYVGIGQVTSWREVVEAQYRYTLEKAKAKSDPAAVKELETLGIPPLDNFDQYMVLRRQLNQYVAASDAAWLQQSWSLNSAQLSASDFLAYQKGLFQMADLLPVLTSMDTRAVGLKFEIPMFLVQGDEDHIVDTNTAVLYFGQIQAPIKHTTLIEGAGHFVMATHAEKVADAIHEDMLLVPSRSNDRRSHN